jgi:ketosteroid isomerase-like protein
MRAKIEASSGALSATVASGDAVAAAAVYAEDALLVPPTGETKRFSGRKKSHLSARDNLGCNTKEEQ